MKNFETPQLFTSKAEELPLSGQALLVLMGAVLSKGLSFRFKAKGRSMSPFICDGDVITVAPFDQHKPGLGDVVAFTHPEKGNLVVHRIVAKRNDHALLVGDNISDTPDGIIPMNKIIGRVICVERNHKHIWVGLGPERFLIAWLSRTRKLLPLRNMAASRRTRLSRKDH